MKNSPKTAHLLPALLAMALTLPRGTAAEDLPVTSAQRATAQQVAQAGVPLSALAPDAPEHYTVKRGDTLWGIAGVFLRSPWRWPELWGMNLADIANPHRIFPGQQLLLERHGDRARLRLAPADPEAAPTQTVRLSPRTRATPLAGNALPTLQTHLIEPFLAEPLIVAEDTMAQAPRLVAAADGRVLITRGDRAYARGPAGAPLHESLDGRPGEFRVFREATALRHPLTQAVLGYEARFVGRALLVRGESVQAVASASGKPLELPVPAALDIVSAREEMRVGDRLLPEPPRQVVNYQPRAPEGPVEGGLIVSMYGNAVGMAGQNQVVVINKGLADGLQSGHVLAVLKDGPQLTDRSQPGRREAIKLPDERNGLLMVFRPFERLSYALILETRDGVRVGDRLSHPR